MDENHTAVVAIFRAYQCSVVSTAGVGDGFPDLVVGFQGVTHLIEIKDGEKTASRRKLTDDEREWHEAWLGEPVEVVESPAQAAELACHWDRLEVSKTAT